MVLPARGNDTLDGATRFLCIVGKHTHKSAWVNWEIEKAVELARTHR